ncbi:MAG: metallophosphoesterase [Theionarchaea archaeon]|nr:metallophosphoesterase [Theionarchaea archaeon]
MLIGIIADTHDRLSTVGRACTFFREYGIDTLVHAGDFISPFVVPYFEGFQVYGSFGNNDGEKKGLSTKFADIGAVITDYFCEVSLGGISVAVTHGHIPSLLNLLISSHRHDLVVTGHTHSPEIRIGSPIIINPGECCGYLSHKRTVALFDTQKREGKIIEVR